MPWMHCTAGPAVVALACHERMQYDVAVHPWTMAVAAVHKRVSAWLAMLHDGQ